MSKRDRSAGISESFKNRADSAAFYEAWAGAVLSRMGLWTTHHPLTLAKEIGVPLSYYKNTWDLDVSPDGVVYEPVEVKSINIPFHDPKDFPHLGLLVCSEASWQKKWPGKTTTGRHFLLVSRETGGLVWLPKGTETGTKEVTDRTRNETYTCRTATKGQLEPLSAFVADIKGVGVFG